jgi:hypothetical protein
VTLGELGRSGKKKKLFRDRIRGAAMRCEGFKQDRDEGSNVPEDSLSRRGWIWEWWQLERKDVGGSARFGNGVEWSGMVLQMRIVVELCCTALCSALATVGDLRRGPCWHRIGWWWARHRPPKPSSLSRSLSSHSLSLSQTLSLALTGKRAIPLLAPHSPNQTGVDRTRPASILSTSRRRFPGPLPFGGPYLLHPSPVGSTTKRVNRVDRIGLICCSCACSVKYSTALHSALCTLSTLLPSARLFTLTRLSAHSVLETPGLFCSCDPPVSFAVSHFFFSPAPSHPENPPQLHSPNTRTIAISNAARFASFVPPHSLHDAVCHHKWDDSQWHSSQCWPLCQRQHPPLCSSQPASEPSC